MILFWYVIHNALSDLWRLILTFDLLGLILYEYELRMQLTLFHVWKCILFIAVKYFGLSSSAHVCLYKLSYISKLKVIFYDFKSSFHELYFNSLVYKYKTTLFPINNIAVTSPMRWKNWQIQNGEIEIFQ